MQDVPKMDDKEYVSKSVCKKFNINIGEEETKKVNKMQSLAISFLIYLF